MAKASAGLCKTMARNMARRSDEALDAKQANDTERHPPAEHRPCHSEGFRHDMKKRGPEHNPRGQAQVELEPPVGDRPAKGQVTAQQGCNRNEQAIKPQ